MGLEKISEIITEVDLYITRSGRIAFLEGMHVREFGLKSFSGYIVGRTRGKAVFRALEWLQCGKCMTSIDDGDHIVRRV